MEPEDVQKRITQSLQRLAQDDRYLLENDLSARCIAARLALYLQQCFPEHAVDVEYNRDGGTPKKLGLEPDCANRLDRHGEAYVVPDVVVHRRGPEGPNLLVLEVKKTTNPEGTGCDEKRIEAFRQQHCYSFGAVVLCETRNGKGCGIELKRWFGS